MAAITGRGRLGSHEPWISSRLPKQGVTFENAKGSHVTLHLTRRQSVLPMHAKELKTAAVEGIKKQLGLKGK